MSTGIDISFVRERYRQMPDAELIRVLTQDAAGLTLEAINVVKEEIERRGLDPNIVKGVEAQQKYYSTQDLDRYCELIRTLPCPITGSSSEKLNATLIAEVRSFILFTQYKKKIVVGSPAVLDKANDKALTNTILMGWWGLPWGVIRTIQAITINIDNKRKNRMGTPTDHLRSFVRSKIGEIETYKDNKEKLLEIISDN